MTITHQEEKRINKIMRSIKIHHKLYFRTAKGEVRRLDKTADTLYQLVMVHFLKQGGASHYEEINKDSKHWSDLKPINLAIPIEYEAEFKKLQKAIGSNVDNVMVTYNGSWKLLVNIFVAPQQK
jgi:hypothetical protein